MGCGINTGRLSKCSSDLYQSPRLQKRHLSIRIPNNLWLNVFDYLSMRELAQVSQVCRPFYKLSGDKSLIAKFAGSAYTQPPAKRANPTQQNVYVFTKLDTVHREPKGEYDIVGDREGKYVAQNPIALDEEDSVRVGSPCFKPKLTPKFISTEDLQKQFSVDTGEQVNSIANQKFSIVRTSKRSSLLDCVDNPYALKFAL
eukprot:TRINITY_DN7771_c0_g1_i3.p1 TRINITY_DN7771_c0_g1~~TRINITY_DN7771_c0_g1_i3.p1  ORF type:complete len:200 (+),score=26.88 TRINITY_DN7771_c0_g1_i3:123-722(+)